MPKLKLSETHAQIKKELDAMFTKGHFDRIRDIVLKFIQADKHHKFSLQLTVDSKLYRLPAKAAAQIVRRIPLAILGTTQVKSKVQEKPNKRAPRGIAFGLIPDLSVKKPKVCTKCQGAGITLRAR